MSLWVEVCSQGHRPQLEGIYWKPLVHTEWVVLSQDTASSGPLAKLTPAGPGQGQNCQPKDAMHIGEIFTLPIYEYVNLSIKSIFGT